MAEVITTIRDDYGIIRQPITNNNPQAEALMERPNQTLGNATYAKLPPKG
jgi:hypothetical protein